MPSRKQLIERKSGYPIISKRELLTSGLGIAERIAQGMGSGLWNYVPSLDTIRNTAESGLQAVNNLMGIPTDSLAHTAQTPVGATPTPTPQIRDGMYFYT